MPHVIYHICLFYHSILLLGIVVVFTVQTEAYKLEGIHKEKEGTYSNNCTCVIDYSLINMMILSHAELIFLVD